LTQEQKQTKPENKPGVIKNKEERRKPMGIWSSEKG